MVQMAEDQHINRVTAFFEDKTLLITGGSGFLGKVLIEKLLRCTQIRKIFMLVRFKKGKSAQERVEDILNNPLFDHLREKRGDDIFKKIVPVLGDISKPDLALSNADRTKIAEETEIIYHSAATVRFDEALKTAVLINVRGTNLLLSLAEECKNLIVFSHISTAYCHEDQEILNEDMYPAPADPYQVIQLCEWFDEDLIETVSKNMRGSHANTYSFTKALGEAVIQNQMTNLPIIVLRPSAVIPIWKEPLPGWTDNINGPMGLLIGAGKGVIRTMYGSGDNFADYVPVDVIANGLIISAYAYVTNKGPRVFNLTSTDEKQIKFQEIIDIGRTIVTTELPFNVLLWYPGGSMTTSKLYHYIALALFQLLPALLIDAFLLLINMKPFLIKIQKRIIRGYDVFEYYVNRKWIFKKDNSIQVRNSLNTAEKLMFQTDANGFDLEDYIAKSILGARRYILKETDHTIPRAKRLIIVMWGLDITCKALFVIIVVYFLFKKFLY